MRDRILVLGYLGYITNQLDGQTIKTRNIYHLLLSEEYLIGKTFYFDTQVFKRGIIQLFRMISYFIRSKIIIYIPGQRSLKFLFPIVYIICRILKIKIIYIVVGGWLYEYLQNKSLHRLLLKRLELILPETKSLSNNLSKYYGFKNVKLFPNFRIHNYKPIIKNTGHLFRIVFMARITKLKGIDLIFKLAKYLESKYPYKENVLINFFGPISKEDKEYFYQQVNSYSIIEYKGILQPLEIHAKLNEYDLMVFPTRYPGEGAPGTIIDAYIAGIPVVASNWKYISEFVEVGKTGFLFNPDNEYEFYKYVEQLYHDRDLLFQMKIHAHEKSKEYSPDTAWKIIKPYLNLK